MSLCLIASSGADVMSEVVGGPILSEPFPRVFTEEALNYVIAELEAWDFLASRGIFNF